MEIIPHEFQHVDARRRLTQILTEYIKQINVYEAKKDACLGNHFHKETIEYFYIINGTITYNDKEVVNPGTLFRVNPLEKHMIRCMTNVKMMTFLTKAYSEKDKDLWME